MFKFGDPYAAFRFRIEIDGLIVGGFTEVSGLRLEIETEEYREGGVNSHVLKFPKNAGYSNIVLRRGFTNDSLLWNWAHEVASGTIKKRSARIILVNSYGIDVKWWLIKDAYPVRYEGPALDASSSGVAFESIELVHEGFLLKGILDALLG